MIGRKALGNSFAFHGAHFHRPAAVPPVYEGLAPGYPSYTPYGWLQLSWFQQMYAQQYYMQ